MGRLYVKLKICMNVHMQVVADLYVLICCWYLLEDILQQHSIVADGCLLLFTIEESLATFRISFFSGLALTQPPEMEFRDMAPCILRNKNCVKMWSHAL